VGLPNIATVLRVTVYHLFALQVRTKELGWIMTRARVQEADLKVEKYIAKAQLAA
jgi:hypothetical protein